MSTPDLLKVVMSVGILIALWGIRWLNKENKALDDEIQRESARVGRLEEKA